MEGFNSVITGLIMVGVIFGRKIIVSVILAV